MLNKLNEACKAAGLHMNFENTTVMTSSKVDRLTEAKVDNITLQMVTQRNYLDRYVITIPRSRDQIKNQINVVGLLSSKFHLESNIAFNPE